MAEAPVLITGAGGLIGAALVRRLAGDFPLVGLDLPRPPDPPPPAENVPVDMGSDESVRRALESVRRRHGTRLSAVVHLAAYYDFSGHDSPKYEEITVRGTGRLLRGLRDFQVDRFVFSSTMLVHAPCRPGRRVGEDSPLQPKWAYPRSKVAAENLIRAERGAVPCAILRIAGVYDDRCRSLPLAHQIQRIHERRLLGKFFPGDPSHGQSFLHLEDLTDMLVRVIRRRKELPPETLLLAGEPEALSYRELQRTFGRLIHGREWPAIRVPKPLAKLGAAVQSRLPGGDPFIRPWTIDIADDHYALDVSRARSLLGWVPARSLRNTIPAMVAALKADPAAWYRDNKLAPPSGHRAAPAPAAARRG